MRPAGPGEYEYIGTPTWSAGLSSEGGLDLVDIDVLLILAFTVLVELDVVLETFVAIGVGLVDLGALWELAVGFQATSLIGVVLEDDISLLVLVVSQREQDDVSLVDPDLLPQLASNVRQTLLAIEAQGLQTAVTQHLHDLRIFLTFFLEGEFTLLVVVFVLATTSVLTTLYD